VNRRTFLRAASLGGSAVMLGVGGAALAAEGPLETNRIRLTQIPGICIAPQFVAEELLKAEGFGEVQYIKRELTDPRATYKDLAMGDVDISMAFVAPFIIQVDAGDPLALLAGIHVGCYELWGNGQIRAVRDLKGKTVSIPSFGSSHHVFLASIAAHVGLDPNRDINFVTHPPAEGMRLFADGKVDAYMAFPPDPQELRAGKAGRVIVNSAVDRPWSQYFCCVVAANRTFAQKHPVATKRALRAILKAANICAVEPARAAKVLVDRGFAKRYDWALQTMKDLPYDKWRVYDAQDTVRYYALRLREAGMIKATPQKILADGTDWRFLNELKRELKA
jgi:NitT/TauT family transport system substrate-binding protein